MNITQDLRDLQVRACRLRQHIVRMVGVGKTGHIGGSCSCADIVAALYFGVMNVDPVRPDKPDRDRFILSKGHAALVLYAALAERGFFPLAELDRVKQLGAMLQGHPDRLKTPGVEANTGSLGQGLSMANGMALASKLDRQDYRIYVILGDGEINEGQVWEAAMFSAFRRLDNVIAILDRNGLQAMGATKVRLDTRPLDEKWRGFGWSVLEIDGHNMAQILDALGQAKERRGSPTMILANTVKGKGISFAENNPGFHNGMMTQDQYDLAQRELCETLRVLQERPSPAA
ncbi:MAG: transketolase [Limisphaerales bacterium]